MNEKKILDVGCGNNSARKIKNIYSNVIYHGIDHEDNYNNDKSLTLIDKFFKKNLMLDHIDDLDTDYDVIMMSHIIEHLSNGENVIDELSKKVKVGGEMYIEYPSIKSLNLPHMKGTLNFFDDNTHIRLYSLIELSNLLIKNGFIIERAGYRRDIIRRIINPFGIIIYFIIGKPIASLLWDYLDFAEFIYAKKVK